jgi:hypothetical protein
MKKLCEALVYGFSVAGCSSVTTELLGVAGSAEWWLICMGLCLFIFACLKHAVGDSESQKKYNKETSE